MDQTQQAFQYLVQCAQRANMNAQEHQQAAAAAQYLGGILFPQMPKKTAEQAGSPSDEVKA